MFKRGFQAHAGFDWLLRVSIMSPQNSTTRSLPACPLADGYCQISCLKFGSMYHYCQKWDAVNWCSYSEVTLFSLGECNCAWEVSEGLLSWEQRCEWSPCLVPPMTAKTYCSNHCSQENINLAAHIHGLGPYDSPQTKLGLIQLWPVPWIFD